MESLAAVNAAYSFSPGVDLISMMRGDGEWRNMQEVIRKTFHASFSQIERQQEQITQLVQTTHELRRALAGKLSQEEVDSLIQNKDKKAKAKYVQRSEFDEVKTHVANIAVDLERRAMIRYVDESLKRKIDKTDVILRQNTSGPQAANDINKLTGDIGIIKGRIDGNERAINNITEALRLSR